MEEMEEMEVLTDTPPDSSVGGAAATNSSSLQSSVMQISIHADQPIQFTPSSMVEEKNFYFCAATVGGREKMREKMREKRQFS